MRVESPGAPFRRFPPSGKPADRFRCGRIAATPGAGDYRARVQTREPTTLRPGASTARESALIG